MTRSRGSKSVEVQRVWEVYDERLQFMSRQDALQLDESLDAGDVSRAWLVWSGAAEVALADAYRFSGGPLPSRGLVLGRSSAVFRVVRLGGHRVRKARANIADDLDAAAVFLYRDSSIAPLLDMRRRFKAVVDVLGTMIRSGVSLSRSVELAVQWDRILALRPMYPVTLDDLSINRGVDIGAFFHAASGVRRRLSDFIHQVVVQGGGVGFGRIPWCIPIDGFVLTWFHLLPFFSANLILLLMVLVSFQILQGWMKNSERLGFPTFAALGKGRPALTNSIMRLMGGCHFCLKSTCPG